jgi:O-acetylserine/cysteine efflux transporter
MLEGPETMLDAVQNLSWLRFGAVAYIAYISTLFGFGVWNWLLRQYPLSKLAPFTLLVPIVGMLSSALVLGEPLQWWKITAAGLILVGLGINVLASRVQVAAPIEPKPEEET